MYDSNGVKQNYETAISWYQKAVTRESLKAAHRLARCYEYGEGIDQNFGKAMELLEPCFGEVEKAERDWERLDEVTALTYNHKEESRIE